MSALARAGNRVNDQHTKTHARWSNPALEVSTCTPSVPTWSPTEERCDRGMTINPPDNDVLLTYRQAARELGVSLATIRRRVDDGSLANVRLGPSRVFISRRQLADFIERAREAGDKARNRRLRRYAQHRQAS